jgi:hypothetical protein
MLTLPSPTQPSAPPTRGTLGNHPRRGRALRVLLAGALLLVAGLLPTGEVRAQDPQVMGAVTGLFDAMRARDGARALEAFLPDARIVMVELAANGTPRVQAQGASTFAAAVGQGGDPWDEPVFAPQVQIDGGLAHVWTFYRFYVGTQFSHCGTNSIQLAQTADGWKIAAITYSRRTTDCDPPEG